MAKLHLESFDEESLLGLINTILALIDGDRAKASEQYDKFSDTVHSLGPQNVLVSLNEMAESIERFLRHSDGSIDKLVKVAKLVSEITAKKLKLDEGDYILTDEDREQLTKYVAEVMPNATEL